MASTVVKGLFNPAGNNNCFVNCVLQVSPFLSLILEAMAEVIELGCVGLHIAYIDIIIVHTT
jgi:hypothetical protein